jgi:predicted metal-binding membrane protein
MMAQFLSESQQSRAAQQLGAVCGGSGVCVFDCCWASCFLCLIGTQKDVLWLVVVAFDTLLVADVLIINTEFRRNRALGEMALCSDPILM